METELLQEYRTALISEVVTGKVDVWEFANNAQSRRDGRIIEKQAERLNPIPKG